MNVPLSNAFYFVLNGISNIMSLILINPESNGRTARQAMFAMCGQCTYRHVAVDIVGCEALAATLMESSVV
jgi:hypothetical protein